jgi:hypothetical protein
MIAEESTAPESGPTVAKFSRFLLIDERRGVHQVSGGGKTPLSFVRFNASASRV